MIKRFKANVDPRAAKFMQQEIRCDRQDLCRCQIADIAEECYRGNVMYVLETPEESGTDFGYGTAIVHAKCDRPVYLTADQHRSGQFPSRWEFFNK